MIHEVPSALASAGMLDRDTFAIHDQIDALFVNEIEALVL
jgi:hypothetical protein